MPRRPGSLPERLVLAVEDLQVRPDDRILEIGCGRGVAAALICQHLTGGHLLGLDRSATATAAATARNAEAVAAGRARFTTTALEDTDPATLGWYDKVLAINVNLFWVRPARHELGLIAQLLRPGGWLRLVYDPPDAQRLTRLEATLLDHLRAAGYTGTTSTRVTARTTLLEVTAQPAAQA